jgi:hypothetical protein
MCILSGETISISMKPPCKTLGMTKLFLDAIFPRVPPKTSVSDTVLGHIFSPKDFCIWYSFESYLLPQRLLYLIQFWVISSPPKTSVSDTVLSHIFSQQCKPKQLKRYKAFIDNCLKCSEKKYDRCNHEADI